MMSKVSTIILNWNGLNDTRECLDSLKKIEYSNYEAMAMKLPCITSELTRKGITNSDDNVLLVAETPNEYAELILRL